METLSIHNLNKFLQEIGFPNYDSIQYSYEGETAYGSFGSKPVCEVTKFEMVDHEGKVVYSIPYFIFTSDFKNWNKRQTTFWMTKYYYLFEKGKVKPCFYCLPVITITLKGAGTIM